MRDDHRMVRRGLYRYIRHPMYTAIGAWMVATPLIVQSWLGLLPLFGLIGWYRRARIEESLLRQSLGEDYVSDRQQTGMFLPRIF